MGLFDLPGPIFDVIDGLLAMAMPPVLRLVSWGIFSGWLTMVVYRVFSDQAKIGALKTLQKQQQKKIAEFDGEFAELMPIIRHTLTLGFRQLRLALGPALLATVPVLFVIIWVAGEFAYRTPDAGSEIFLSIEPSDGEIDWSPMTEVRISEGGWIVNWPSQGHALTMTEDQQPLLVLPLEQNIPIIHKKKWWNLLIANPLGYLPEDSKTDVIHIELPEAVIIQTGPAWGWAWMRGWMFSFFSAFLLSSFLFKRLLRLD